MLFIYFNIFFKFNLFFLYYKLVENTTISARYKPKHGLCFHIKTLNNNILFDLGSDDLFIINAIKLNIYISEVDTVIISHDHNDHGGGLSAFLLHNKKAKIYIHKNAFTPHYASILGLFKHSIGLDSKLQNNNRIVLLDGNFNIDDELYLFSNIKTKNLMPTSNKVLLMKINNEYLQDDFSHEQNLIIKENNKYTLLAGCAHNGIVNIVEKAEDIICSNLNTVISGFHLFNRFTKKSEDPKLINNISTALKGKKTIFYTCHCSGIKPFNILQEKLGDQIKYLSTGQVIDV